MRKPECPTTSAKLRKGLWSPEEDEKLVAYMLRSGQGSWTDVARNAGLQRCGKSCRLRWINYLRPDLKRGAFSPQEEELIVRLHAMLGNRCLLFFACDYARAASCMVISTTMQQCWCARQGSRESIILM
jgi:hypothetical protein